MSTLTFVYQDSTAVLGPLARTSEPHTYDLCQTHAARMTAPIGWELLRIEGAEEVPDDLVALAEAVRPARRPAPAPAPASGRTGGSPERGGRHLQVVRTPDA